MPAAALVQAQERAVVAEAGPAAGPQPLAVQEAAAVAAAPSWHKQSVE